MKRFAWLLCLPLLFLACVSSVDRDREMVNLTHQRAMLGARMLADGMPPAMVDDFESAPERFRQQLQRERVQEDLAKYLEWRTPY